MLSREEGVIRRIIMIVLFLVSLLILFKCGNDKLLPESYELKFESELWKDNASLNFDKNDLITVRQKMLGDLVNNYFIGKTRKELISLLGESSSKMDPDGNGPVLSYPTGPERDSYMAIDYEWLIIEFDKLSKYKRYIIRTD